VEQVIKVMDMIASDMERDAKEIDGQDFNGPNVAVAIGKLCAATQANSRAIAKLAEVIETKL